MYFKTLLKIMFKKYKILTLNWKNHYRVNKTINNLLKNMKVKKIRIQNNVINVTEIFLQIDYKNI